MRKLICSLTLLLAGFQTFAQQLRPATSPQIYNEIARLNNLVNVLYLAAHPDDENTRLLAWLVNDQHIPTAYLSLTRGDGGQNILGSEQGAALGLIRTHELMEARKIDGAGQFFTSAIDFGFSKNPTETFKHWNEYSLLYDVVWVMRKYRPDVVICRFPPDSRAGHGQHSASAILAEKAFRLSGDKLQYTEQLKYYTPWQPKRLLWNTFRFGSSNTTSEDQFKLPVGQYSPLLGMGYGELAGISRSIHRSQGAGTPSTAGIQKEYFTPVAGDTIHTSLWEGIDISWNRVGKPEIGRQISAILDKFEFTHPERSLSALLDLRKQIATVKDEFWRNQKLEELDKIILHAAGIMAEATTKQASAVSGAQLPFSLRIISRSSLPVTLKRIRYPQEDSALSLNLTSDSLYVIDHLASIPADQPVTEPYWMRTPGAASAQFAIPHDTLRGLEETPNTLLTNVEISIEGVSYTVPVPLSYKKLDPLRGDVVEQLRIVPDASLEPFANLLITKKDGSITSSIRIHSYKEINEATLTVFADNKPVITLPGLRLRANGDTAVSFTITAAMANAIGKETYYLDAELSAGSTKYDRTLRLIQYDHIPTLQYFTSPTAKVIRNDWVVSAKKIGIIEGAGDYTLTLLKLAGLQAEVLKDADLADASRLKSYDAIITGVRAANTEKKMSYWMPVLLQYVQNGGTLVMQYNTLQDLATTNLGPYPFTLSSQRVTEEDAAVEFIDSTHKLLRDPNRITQADFKDWVQERGLYFPNKWDDKYQLLFRMKDTGEDSLSSSTLYTPYGKGQYIYTSLSFFRQLPAGNKGAIRLLMNMLSAGHETVKK